MCHNLSGPTKAVCYREVYAIRGALIFRQGLSGKKRHLEWNCKVSERWQIIGMGGGGGQLGPSKNGRF